MFVNDAVLERAKQPDPLFMFIHTQRTGGSNMLRWLRGVFGDARSYTTQTVEDFTRWNRLPDAAPLKPFQLYGGFTTFKPIDMDGRPLIGLANVRHPFYRTLSIYQMALRHQTQFLHDIAIANDFENFYRLGSQLNPNYFHNLSTRRLAGSLDWNRLVESLDRNFGLVATTNQLHQATRTLIDRLGWDAEPIARSRAPCDAEHYARFEDSSAREEILANNQLDLRLFELVAGGQGIASSTESRVARVAAPTPETVHATTNYEDYDAPFNRARQAEPSLSYSQFYTRDLAKKLRKGRPHNSLGANIVSRHFGRESFRDSSRRQLRKIERLVPVTPSDRVVDYGCGSLRTGAHIIERLEPGHYMGLDVVADFYEMGIAHLEEGVVAEKRPQLAVIDAASVDAAVAFGATITVSLAVMMHVHPDDLGAYIGNLARIAGKPGAALVVQAAISQRPVRYTTLGWAQTREFVEESFAEHGLTVSGETLARSSVEAGHEITIATLCFRKTNGRAGA